MRIVLSFNSLNEIIALPVSYNEIVQGFIYKNLNKRLAQELHDEGFVYGKRSFKLFTFSRLLGKAKIESNYLKIVPPVKVLISSPCVDILYTLAENLLKRQEVKLGDNRLYLESISVRYMPEIKETIYIKMLSPVTIYSTLYTSDGKKKTYYYNPWEREFSELLMRNIVKKYAAFYGKNPLSQDFSIEPVKVKKKDEKIITYKDFIIKGWMGIYKISGNKELLRFAYDAGIGAKNSQGFGCFEVER